VFWGYILFLGLLGTKLAAAGNEAANVLEDMSTSVRMISASARLRRATRLRPYDAFNVSNGNNVSLFGILLTFMVVLIQLRLGEKTLST